MNIRALALAASVAVSALALQTPASAAGVVVGSNDSGNCYPFSCFAGEYGVGSTFQSVYSGAAFGGPFMVDSISLFLSSGGLMDSASYDVAFYSTSAAVNGLSGTFADNRGALLANFGSFTLGGAMPNVLTLDGANFVFNPALGNLLMEVTVTGLTQSVGYSSFFQADYTGAQTSRVWGAGATGNASTGAPVVQFNGQPAAVPEPATWALMIGGFGLAGAALRRRRLAAA